MNTEAAPGCDPVRNPVSPNLAPIDDDSDMEDEVDENGDDGDEECRTADGRDHGKGDGVADESRMGDNREHKDGAGDAGERDGG